MLISFKSVLTVKSTCAPLDVPTADIYSVNWLSVTVLATELLILESKAVILASSIGPVLNKSYGVDVPSPITLFVTNILSLLGTTKEYVMLAVVFPASSICKSFDKSLSGVIDLFESTPSTFKSNVLVIGVIVLPLRPSIIDGLTEYLGASSALLLVTDTLT